ncbi:hypothetical protein GCM10009777_36600 [Microbacterium pumilum]|uniref:DUF222 domain-containing protein n=1 Tax=Microbacterium pumilum TaxID=344165 RepID=A0ABN2T184_9MICO
MWIRGGISDRLTQVLAEQDENALHKPLSPTEAAALYRECKMLLAEDAARRQVASRFGAGDTQPQPGGAVTVTAPSKRNDGDTRTQAALMVTGRRSFTTLERIGRLQDIAADQSLPAEVRVRARAELDAVEGGAPVLPAFRRVSEGQVLAELETVAKSPRVTAETRDAANTAASKIRAGEAPSWGEDPRQFAAHAMAQSKSDQPGPAAMHKVISAELKRFVYTWDDLARWWERFDPGVIASGLTPEEWQRFEQTLEGSRRFAERVRALRADDATTSRRAS